MPQREDGEAASGDEHGESENFLDLSVVRDGRFVLLCLSILLAQLITAWCFLKPPAGSAKPSSAAAAPAEAKNHRNRQTKKAR